MSDLLAAARAYVAKGVSVIPLQPYGKLPAFDVLPQKMVDGQPVFVETDGDGRSVETFLDTGHPKREWGTYRFRLPSDEELVSWFESGSRNIGIVTGGLSRLVVLDEDSDSAGAYLDKLGLVSPIKVKAVRGFHRYFRHPGGEVKNGVDHKLKLDIRGDGGYVAAPPSVRENGHRYEWVLGEGEMPVYVPPATQDLKPSNEPGWLEESLALLESGEMRRPNLLKILGKLWGLGLKENEMRKLVWPAVEKSGLSEEEYNRIASDVMRYEHGNNITYPTQIGGEAPAKKTPRFSVAQFIKDPEPVEWLVPGIFARKGISIMGGLQATSKTWMALDLALSVAGGTPWLNKFRTCQSKVLYIEQERFKGETQRRLVQLLRGRGADPASLDSLEVVTGTAFKLNQLQSAAELSELLKEAAPELVIVDSFSTFHSVNENSKVELQPVMEAIKVLREAHSCAFVFIDHEGKAAYSAEAKADPSAGTISGNQAKLAVVETILTVRSASEGTSMVFPTKSTLGKQVEPFAVEVIDVSQEEKATVVRAI